MALRIARRKRQEFEGDVEPSSKRLLSSARQTSSFNSEAYLESHGWQGKGVALDGHNGKGLKKPLSIPQKRDVKGIGRNRDRAVEWWDTVFEASAKTLKIGPQPSGPDSAESTRAAPAPPTLSLQSASKREHARRMLMSGFIRGEIIGSEPNPVKPAAEPADAPEAAGSVSGEVGRSASKKSTAVAKVAAEGAGEGKKPASDKRKKDKEARRKAKALLASLSTG